MFYYLIVILSCMPIVAYGIDSTETPANNANATIDARTFLRERPHNKQNEQGNTFLHEIALNCSRFDEWKQLSQKMDQFANENGNNIPNPLLENNDHATARKLAKAQFNASGSPICGTLIVFLREAEFLFCDRCSSEEGRKALSENKKSISHKDLS